MAIGDIGAIIDTLEFDPVNANFPDIIHVSGNIYAIAYEVPALPTIGRLCTISIDGDGQIGDSVINTLDFDLVNCQYPDIIHVAGNVYAIAYTGPGQDGWLRTVTISNDGTVIALTGSSLEFNPLAGAYPDIIHVSGDVYAIAYRDNNGFGQLCTVSIDIVGNIGGATLDTLIFEGVFCANPKIIRVSGDVYAIVYRGNLQIPQNDGWVCTVSIADDGTIDAAVIDSWEFILTSGWYPRIIHVSGNIYAIICHIDGGSGRLMTLAINNDGTIVKAIINVILFDPFFGEYPDIIYIAGNVFAIVYRGPDNDGWIKTYPIENDGTIGAMIDSLEFDPVQGMLARIIHVSGNIYAIAYRGPGEDGWVCTFPIEARTIPTVTTNPATEIS